MFCYILPKGLLNNKLSGFYMFNFTLAITFEMNMFKEINLAIETWFLTYGVLLG